MKSIPVRLSVNPMNQLGYVTRFISNDANSGAQKSAFVPSRPEGAKH